MAQAIFRYGVIEPHYAFFWPLAVATLLFRARRLRQTESSWLALALAVALLATIGVYLCSTVNLVAQLQTSTERVLLSAFVPALLLTALLWRGSFRLWRRQGWRWWALAVCVLLAATMIYIGRHRLSDEEVAGISISPFPLALSWVVARHGDFDRRKIPPATETLLSPTGLARRPVRGPLGHLRTRLGCGRRSRPNSRRIFAPVRRQIARRPTRPEPGPVGAPKTRRRHGSVPPGTHVHLIATPALRYHQFYYAAYPWLIVDRSATNTILIEPTAQRQDAPSRR